MRVGLTCDPTRLPPVVQQLLGPLASAEVDTLCGGLARVDELVPLESGDVAGAWVLGRLAAAEALPPHWPAGVTQRMAAFAAALPERLERHAAELARRPFAATRLRRQFQRAVGRQALKVLEEAAALVGSEGEPPAWRRPGGGR